MSIRCFSTRPVTITMGKPPGDAVPAAGRPGGGRSGSAGRPGFRRRSDPRGQEHRRSVSSPSRNACDSAPGGSLCRVHRADANERCRSAQRPGDPQGSHRRRHPTRREAGRLPAAPAARAGGCRRQSWGHALACVRGQGDRRAGRPRRCPQARHPRPLRPAAAHGAANRDGDGRQPADGQEHRRASRRGRLYRRGDARGQTGLYPQGANGRQVGGDDGRRHERRPGAGSG